MPFCPREARLIDGGWDSNVFGTAVWQPVVDIGQVCWLHRDGLVQFCWPNHGGPVQSRLQHHGGPVQVCWQHRGGPLQFPWQHRDGSGWQCCVAGPVDGAGACWLGLARPVLGAWLWPLLGLCPPLQHPCAKRFPRSDVGLPLLTWTAGWACSMVVVGVVNAGMLVWCASSGMSMPLLAAMIALVVGSMLSRPVTVSGAMFACLAWHPHLFSWCASKIPGTATLSFAHPKVASFPRPNTLVTVEAFLAEGSMNRPLLDLGTPGPMAFGGCLCNGCPSDLFADWLTLLRVVLSARPRRHLISCLTSYFLWACLGNPCFDLSRTSTSSKTALSLYLCLPCRRLPHSPFFFLCKFNSSLSIVVLLYLLLMAESLLAQLGDLTFTAEEQDAILVAPDSVAIPAEDFACSLVATEVADPADPVLDPPGLASETSAQSDPAGPEVRADPNAAVRVNPSVAPTATAPAAPEGPAVPATAAPAVRKGQAVPATAAPMVRKGQAVPATAAPMVRRGQTVPTTAATALRTDLPVPNIVAPVVRMPQRAADSPPAPLVPLETDAMVEDVVDEDSSGQNLVADGSLPDDAPYDPLVHAETSAMLEEALEISRDCVLLADMDGVLQADGEDLVNEAIPEAADSIIREVAAKILGADAPSDGSDPPIALAKMGPSPSASPPKSGLSKSAPAGLRRAAMPVVPEHQEFDEWCAARSRTPPANVAVHPSEARASSIPPPRPHKRQAPSSDLSRAKRLRASASSSSRIPSSTKAGMSSVNNSPAETARQSRREK
ncbi:hypothetical protein V6N12_005738 [Hibiscus sabdariffa]|uniref:Uncharacterized protein n=1 Tax=Hibiscus sabdariffa TaxID=183260 RepID=A0ABR2B972_9ROSI